MLKSLLRTVLLASLAWLPLAQAAETPVEGRDYVGVSVGPWSAPPGRIEVAEVFGYTCPHCARFEPQLQQWKSRQAKDVQVVVVPAAFGGSWDAWARVYFAAEKLGVLGRSHRAVFEALHLHGTLPRNATAQELAAFFAGVGVDGEAFRAALAAPDTDEKLRRSARYIREAGLEGTPALVVNGRWRIQPNSFDEMLRIADWLVERERAARPAPTSR
jgi:thiol:disulfide interchange protein DsbA